MFKDVAMDTDIDMDQGSHMDTEIDTNIERWTKELHTNIDVDSGQRWCRRD